MTAAPCPPEQDVILRRESSRTFTIGVNAEPPQVACGPFDEALHRAAGFAAKRHVHLWYTADDHHVSLLPDGELLKNICQEYIEMPGQRLTRAQAQRLWSVDAETCASILDTLVDLKVLEREPTGRYVRFGAGREAATTSATT